MGQRYSVSSFPPAGTGEVAVTGVSVGLAFLLGIFSFLAPCIFPLVPVYLVFLTGQSKTASRLKTLFSGLLFISGFSLVFISLGALAGFAGFYLKLNLPWLEKAAAIFLIVFGLHLLGILKIPWLYQEKRIQIATKKFNLLSPFLVGLSFGLGWSPCIGPALGGLLVVAYSSETALRGLFLLLAYSLGLSVPFLLSALFVERLQRIIRKMGRICRITEIISGLLLVAMGALMLTGYLVILNRWFNFLTFAEDLI